MHNKHLFFLLFLLFLFSSLYSQIKQFEGKVVDDQNKPLAEANVYIKSKSCGVVTNPMGYFNLSCHETDDNDTLVISFLGFKDYLVPLKDFKNYSTFRLTKIDLKIQDEIVIYGERIDILKQDLPHTKSILRFEEIERYGSSEIADLFKSLPAVHIEGNDLDGRVIHIRGSDPEEVNVYVDGILINNLQMNNSADLSLIPVESIESLEIAKGGNLAFLGGGAFGGVVNITIRKNMQEKLLIKGKLGSFQTKYLIGKINIPISRDLNLNYFGQFNRLTPEIEYYPGEKFTDKTENRKIKTEKQNHHINLNYFTKSGQVNGTFMGYFLNYSKPAWRSRYNNYLTSLNYKGTIFGLKNFDVNVNHLYINNSINRHLVDTTQNISTFLSHRLNIRLVKQFGGDDKNLQMYFEYFHDELINNSKIKYPDYENNLYHSNFYDNRISGVAVFSLNDRINIQQDLHWQFYAGTRLDYLANGDNDLTNLIGIKLEYKKTNTIVSPYINYGQNIRYPTLLENAYIRDIIETTPTDTSFSRLEPEYSTGGELGVNFIFYPHFSFLRQINIDFSLFSRVIYNKILRRPFDDIIARIPSARSNTKGLESFIKFQEVLHNFNINFGYTALNIDNPLPNAFKPENKATTQLQYYSNIGLFFTTTYFHEGKSTIWYYDQEDNIQTDEISPFYDMDISMGYEFPISKLKLNFQISGYNIFDNSGYRFYYLKKRYIQFSISIKY